MNKAHTLLLVSLATTFVGVAPCLASEPETTQNVALISPQPPVMDDAAIQRAIESIIKQQNQTIDIKKKIIPNKLDNPIGEHPLRNSDKVLILGGADIMPM